VSTLAVSIEANPKYFNKILLFPSISRFISEPLTLHKGSQNGASIVNIRHAQQHVPEKSGFSVHNENNL
jgi:hypothetical protein